MKLLIELDDDYYHKIMTIKPVHYTARVYIAVQNGTPLDKCKAEDCISREQALRELKESAEHHANNSREIVLLRRDRDIIRALPSVTPQEPILDMIFSIVHPLSIMSTPELEHKAIMQIAEMLEPLCLSESEGKE